MGLIVPREILDRREGRAVFGQDAAGYDRGRPGHPQRVYDVLVERCGLRAGASVVEIGPGTGQATRRLLELGADPLVAIEPDHRLAEYLSTATGGHPETLVTTLEDAELPAKAFDLAVAASSFHWVDEDKGLAKIHSALRPGGWVALWWTSFGDANRPDPFRDATEPLVRGLPRSPSEASGGRPFAHDAETRIAALERAGYEEIEPRRMEWEHTWDTAGIRGLFGSFSPVLSLEPDRREAFLDSIAEVAERDFGGRVTKPVVTALYTARKPR